MPSNYRVLISQPPYPESEHADWSSRGRWPAEWIAVEAQAPFVAAYRLRLSLPQAETRRVHVSADERYELYLNGERVGRGPERGEVSFWPFETYDLPLRAGENVIVARAWTLGDGSPFAQMSLRHGFLFGPDDARLADQMATGHAHWEAQLIGGYHFNHPSAAWGTGFRQDLHADEYPWGVERREGNWGPVTKLGQARFPTGASDVEPTHLLIPATLPPMLDRPWDRAVVRHVSAPKLDPKDPKTNELPVLEAESLATEVTAWNELLQGQPLTIPPHTTRRVIIDLRDYVCAYPELTVSGGASSMIRIDWQEGLFEKPHDSHKGDRAAIEGKYFTTIWNYTDGIGDTYRPDGGAHRRFSTLWWECGCYVEVVVITADDLLTIESLTFNESRYPMENQAQAEASDPTIAQIAKIGFRTLQMCSHETYMDCPFYEQLQYAGDTRLQVLATYIAAGDDRLPRQALRAFDRSRRPDGLTMSRTPSRVVQIIPPFSLWWVLMIHDFALWRGDMAFVKTLMPGLRGVLDHYIDHIKDGIVYAPIGWNFTDWVDGWPSGIPAGADRGANGIISRQLQLALQATAEIETALNEPELARRCTRLAKSLEEGIAKHFWSKQRGLYADDLEHKSFSEHLQALSVIAGATPHSVQEALLKPENVYRTTIYFTHYAFEALGRLGHTDRILERLDLWRDLLKNHLHTTIEMPEPTRSDCHAWGAHPIYHFAAHILGIQPVGVGAKHFKVAPNLGKLEWAKGGVALPTGLLGVDVQPKRLHLTVPPGVTVEAFGRRFEAGAYDLDR
jgi:hypothetical protein